MSNQEARWLAQFSETTIATLQATLQAVHHAFHGDVIIKGWKVGVTYREEISPELHVDVTRHVLAAVVDSFACTLNVYIESQKITKDGTVCVNSVEVGVDGVPGWCRFVSGKCPQKNCWQRQVSLDLYRLDEPLAALRPEHIRGVADDRRYEFMKEHFCPNIPDKLLWNCLKDHGQGGSIMDIDWPGPQISRGIISSVTLDDESMNRRWITLSVVWDDAHASEMRADIAHVQITHTGVKRLAVLSPYGSQWKITLV